jgi:hypothetical protein
MSKNINVNPDHYKAAGRERPGHDLAKRPVLKKGDADARARWERRQRESTAGRRPK